MENYPFFYVSRKRMWEAGNRILDPLSSDVKSCGESISERITDVGALSIEFRSICLTRVPVIFRKSLLARTSLKMWLTCSCPGCILLYQNSGASPGRRPHLHRTLRHFGALLWWHNSVSPLALQTSALRSREQDLITQHFGAGS